MDAIKSRAGWLGAVVATATGVAQVGLALAESPAPPAAKARTEAVAIRSALREKAFWHCDYVATTRGVQFTAAEECSRVTEEIKQEKFGGDYDRLVDWWRERKSAEHLKQRLEHRY